jgi:hypothetical protein
MKTTMKTLLGAGALALVLGGAAFAQGGGGAGGGAGGSNTDAGVSGGVNPSPGTMPNRTPGGTVNVDPATGQPMGGGKNSEQRMNPQPHK